MLCASEQCADVCLSISAVYLDWMGCVSVAQMQGMLNSPQFLQQMSAMMSNPAIIDQVIASSPQLASMGPQVRQAFQDEGFRQMMCAARLYSSWSPADR